MNEKRRQGSVRRAFTLVELLVVIGDHDVAPRPSAAGDRAGPAPGEGPRVNAELRDIGLALEAYSFDHEGKYPPVRVDCMLGGHFYQLPYELTDEGYLPKPPPGTFLSTGIEDRFNPGYTYKYRSVGTLIYNRTTVMPDGAYLWVPNDFPDNEQTEGQTYSSLQDSPVSWVLYSQGPNYDDQRMKQMQYPVPRATWLSGPKAEGIIVRMRLKNGQQIGTFER